MHRSEFLKIVKEAFPELRNIINAEEGLLHFEMDVFRRYAQKAIFDGDKDAFVRCADIANMAYHKGNIALKNAVDVSFVEMLDFSSEAKKKAISYEWAWQAMPSQLKELYIAFHGSSKI